MGNAYFHLSSPSLPYTEKLYEDDASNSVKEIKDINCNGKRLNAHGMGNYRAGYNRGFRGRGRELLEVVVNILVKRPNWG